LVNNETFDSIGPETFLGKILFIDDNNAATPRFALFHFICLLKFLKEKIQAYTDVLNIID
jgi:hypothetical protein